VIVLNSLHLEGLEAFNKQDYPLAKTFFLKAIGENPEESETYWLLGKSLFLCNEKSSAIEYLKKHIALNQTKANECSNPWYAYDLLGQCYEAEHKNNEAMACYLTATQQNVQASSAWHNLGLLYLKSAQNLTEEDHFQSLELFQKAHFFLKKALEINSTHPVFLHSVASWYEHYAVALKKIEKPQEGVQASIDRCFNLALEYHQNAASKCLESDNALKNIIRSNRSECLAQYGHHLYQAQNFTKALDFYTQAHELDGENEAVINQIGMCLFKQNRFAQARTYFLDLLTKTQDPQEQADAWLNTACTYRLEKAWENAQEALNKAKALAPEDPCIQEEEQKLRDLRSHASLIETSQIRFYQPNTENPGFAQDQVESEVESQKALLNPQ
jgi:tetratricopeptide (TPR) repeat protein